MPVESTMVCPPFARKSVSFRARISKISALSMVMSGANCAPGTTESRASWTATTPNSWAGMGPRTVLTVLVVGVVVSVIGTTFRQRHAFLGVTRWEGSCTATSGLIPRRTRCRQWQARVRACRKGRVRVFRMQPDRHACDLDYLSTSFTPCLVKVKGERGHIACRGEYWTTVCVRGWQLPRGHEVRSAKAAATKEGGGTVKSRQSRTVFRRGGKTAPAYDP